MSDDEATKPSAMPPQPKTTELPAADPVIVAITGLTKAIDRMGADVKLVSNDLGIVKDRLAIVENWKLIVERTPPLTSERAHAIVVEHASQIDLDAKAREAEGIIKDAERDRQIAETRALVEQAATKEDVKTLAEGTATKAEVETMLAPTAEKVDRLTATQDVQLAILSRLDKVASNPTVKVIAGMIATALLTWLASHGGSLK